MSTFEQQRNPLITAHLWRLAGQTPLADVAIGGVLPMQLWTNTDGDLPIFIGMLVRPHFFN